MCVCMYIYIYIYIYIYNDPLCNGTRVVRIYIYIYKPKPLNKNPIVGKRVPSVLWCYWGT